MAEIDHHGVQTHFSTLAAVAVGRIAGRASPKDFIAAICAGWSAAASAAAITASR
jgi:hypothetical protein